MFWIQATWLNAEKRKSRYLIHEELTYCPACGVELKTLREEDDADDMGYAR